ncbi:MAG: SPOR domain-containing protein [Paracoccaceae bacterium]
MAVHDFDRFEEQDFAPLRGGRLMHILGGVTSVALVLGAVVWGYKLAVRNVQGVPIVRAMEGPMRIAPETPGGSVADHQGLAVNAVAAIGSAAPMPESVTLAPSPVALTDEDVAGLGAFAEPDTTLLTASAALSDPATLSPGADPAPAPMDTAAAVDALLAEVLTPEEQMAAASADLLDAGAPMRSLFPKRRPGAANANPVTQVQDVVAMATPTLDPATLAVGTPLVQLGTFNSEEDARAEWAKIEARFADLLGGKAVVLQSAKSGGATFVRLRAQGFANEDDARRFCTALLTENTACVPTAHR